MRWVPIVALIALGVALACAWTLFDQAPPMPIQVDDPRVRALSQEVDELSRRLEEFEHADRLEGDDELASFRVADGAGGGAVREEVLAPGSGSSSEDAEEDAAGDSRKVRARLRRLAGLEGDEERLIAARDLVHSESPLEKVAGVRVLAELAPAEAFAVVDRWLREAGAVDADADGKRRRDDWFVVDAARTLEERGDARCMQAYVATLQPALGSSDVAEKRRAVSRLGTTRSASVTPLLGAQLRDANAEIRIAALDGLRTSGDASAIAAVELLLDDPVGAVRDRAVRTLETLRRREGDAGERDGPRKLPRRSRR